MFARSAAESGQQDTAQEVVEGEESEEGGVSSIVSSSEQQGGSRQARPRQVITITAYFCVTRLMRISLYQYLEPVPKRPSSKHCKLGCCLPGTNFPKRPSPSNRSVMFFHAMFLQCCFLKWSSEHEQNINIALKKHYTLYHYPFLWGKSKSSYFLKVF